MIRTHKLTPMTHGYRITSRRPPQPELAVIVRAKYVCAPGEPCTLTRVDLATDEETRGSDDAMAIMEEGAYLLGQGSMTAETYEERDDARAGQVVYPGDFAEFKPKAEVMVRAHCHPPGGKATQCPVSFEVFDATGKVRVGKKLTVSGPRVWVDRILGGKHTEPLEFSSMPIDYAHAYGGPAYPNNPVGLGHEIERLPNVEDPRFPLTDGEPPLVPGFGPINPEWPLRKDKMGEAWGEQWEKERAPWYAVDYDWTQQNAAPPDQQVDAFWSGDETLRFTHLHPEAEVFSVILPGHRPRAFIELVDGTRREVKLVCDTLFADLVDGALYVSWRGHTPVKEDDLSDVAYLLVAHEEAGEQPKPADEYVAELAEFSADPIGLNKTPVATLKKFDEALESGELERRLDELDDDEDPVTAVFGDLIDLGPQPTELRAKAKEATDKIVERDPEARGHIIEQLKKTLREMREGGGGGGAAVGMDPETGEMNVGPLLKSILSKKAQIEAPAKEAGGDPSAGDAALQSALDAANLPGASPEDRQIPTEDRPLPEPVPNADFSGLDLSDQNYAGLDLRGCNFEGATLNRTSLKGATLRDASFSSAALGATDLRDADCTGANFSLARLTGTKGQGANFTDASFDQAVLHKCDLTGSKLRNATGKMIMAYRAILDDVDAEGATFEKGSFDEMSMKGVSFKKATLPFTLFRNVELGGARFDGAELPNTAFFKCDLAKSVFFGARGDTTNFKDTSLRGADASYAAFPASMFMGVDAVAAKFDATDMPRVRFYRAALRDASFDQANLLYADMRKTALQKTRFVGANLYGAAFIEAYGTDTDFSKANMKTTNFKRNRLVKR